MIETFGAVVIGGPSGATAAADLAKHYRWVPLLDWGGRIKPCGGAIPPVLVREAARARLLRAQCRAQRAVLGLTGMEQQRRPII